MCRPDIALRTLKLSPITPNSAARALIEDEEIDSEIAFQMKPFFQNYSL